MSAVSEYVVVAGWGHNCQATVGAPRDSHTIMWKWVCPTCGLHWEGTSRAGGGVMAVSVGGTSWPLAVARQHGHAIGVDPPDAPTTQRTDIMPKA